MLALVDEMLYYARDYERTEAQSVAVLLDELDRVNTIRTNDGSHVHWVNKKRFAYREYHNCTFLALTIEAGLRIYVKEKLESNKMLITDKGGRPLLDYACRHRLQEETSLQEEGWSLDPEMVRLLLEHGSDPNQPVGPTGEEGHTVWGLFVDEWYNGHYLDKRMHKSLETVQEIMEFMIDHGADLTVKIKMAGGRRNAITTPFQHTSPQISVFNMLELMFGADRAARLTARMEEYTQRNAPPPPPPPPSLFQRLLGWK
jgi:hypothetical protein